MKLRQLAGFGIAAVAAASFAMVSTSAMAANHHANTKSVKCAVNTCKDGKACTVMVSKAVCDQFGGTVKTAAAAKAPKVSQAASTNAQTATAQPAQQVAGQQTAATTNANQNQ